MSQAAITLIVLVVAIILFVIDILPMGLVAFCVPVVLYFLGIIEVGDIFTDVINSNVILIIAMCVMFFYYAYIFWFCNWGSQIGLEGRK